MDEKQFTRMESRSLNLIAQACGGRLLRPVSGGATPVHRICTDSRQAKPGDLFFALKGDRFDGHDFLKDVVHQGASALVVNQARSKSVSSIFDSSSPGCAVIEVGDTRIALGRLGARYRQDFQLPIIAVGGSNGKTTTKDLLTAVLRQRFNTLCNETSFNNDIGVPLTLLSLEQTHQIAVLEVGTNHPGELAPLLRLIQPQAGVITNIGREHLEFFKDLAGVAQEEGWLAELLPESGKLFVNGDNEWTETICRRTKAQVVRVGLGPGNDWIARDLQMDDSGVAFVVECRNELRPPRSSSLSEFKVKIEQEDDGRGRGRGRKAGFAGQYRVNLLGRHQVANALLVIAAAAEFGLTPAEIRRGLLNCPPPKMRMQLWEINGVRVLDDAYNANADSMLAALQTLHDLPCRGHRVAVLGDMAELGEHTAAAHEEIGRRTAQLSIARLVAVGKMAAQTAAAAREAGLREVLEFPDLSGVASVIKASVKAGDLVLLKASRAAGFERLSEALRNSGGTQ